MAQFISHQNGQLSNLGKLVAIPITSVERGLVLILQLVHKKYLAGHKYHLSPYEKAQLALKKQKKKNKNKFGFDQKELQVNVICLLFCFLFTWVFHCFKIITSVHLLLK